MLGRGGSWFGWGPGMGRGMGLGHGMGLGRGMGRGISLGRGIGMGFGRGNPYPFCRFYPWLPRRWWACGSYYYPTAQPGGYGWDPYYSAQAPYPQW